jgi:homospermidine synthase
VLAGHRLDTENPTRGIVEGDETDFRRCLELQRPYLGPVVGHYTDRTPLDGRGELFPEDVDRRANQNETSKPIASSARLP